MSDAPGTPSPQPEEGQRGEGTQELSEYARTFLETVPDEHRDTVSQYLPKAWDDGVTKKLQDAATYRQQWEPFEQLGIHEYDPEELGPALQILADENLLNDWIAQEAKARGLIPAEPGTETPATPPAGEPAGPQGEALTRQEVEQLLADRDQAMQAAIDQAQREEQATADLTNQLATLRTKHGFKEGSEEEEDILDVASGLLDRNPELGLTAVEKAAERYYSRIGQAENGIVAGKLAQPGTPETGGAAPGLGRIVTREAAQAAAAARLAAAQRQ